ncbi:MAG: sigma-70 family RNA polymerase sigma factor [Planctomycetes bacterium]|nr:sigma-70 family RNA polymerase sigma factor [Planctomycetota bacterium]
MSSTMHLVESARDGDRQALSSLYARHEGRLLAAIRARMSAEVRAHLLPEDVLQETLLESTRRLDAFVPDGPSSFYRWLVGIARNKLREAARAGRAQKRARERPLDEPPLASWTSPSAHAVRAEKKAHLEDALAALPERQAEAVRLRWLEGLTTSEAAEQLGCTESALKSLVSRGMEELARRLVDGS